MRTVILNIKGFSGRMYKLINYVLLLLTVGSCMYVMSVINTKEAYMEILTASSKEHSKLMLTVATMVLSTPVFWIMILTVIGFSGKEILLKSGAIKFKANAAGAVSMLAISLIVSRIISYPAV